LNIDVLERWGGLG